jgi:tetratricopeptide (TPR) repeat protein
MLESIREYALSRLSDTDAAEVRRRHLAHYLSLIERERDFDVEDEIHNLRIGMSLAESHRNGAAILQMMIGTYAYWLEGAARLSEASEWMQRGLSLLGADVAALRADALWRYAYFVDGLGDVPRAVSLSEEASKTATGVGDDALRARILRSLGVFYARLGLLERATEVLRQGMAHAEAAGDTGMQDRILLQLAEVLSASSTVEATDLIARAIALARATGDRQRLAEGLETLGYFRLVAGDHEGARGPLEEAMSLLRDEAGYEDLTFALLSLAQARARGGDRGGAVALLAEALEYLGKASGPVSGQFFCLLLAGTLAELDDSDLCTRLIGAADAAATANAVPFQRLERALRLRVLRAALRHQNRDTVRASVEAGCADGWERTIAAVSKGVP